MTVLTKNAVAVETSCTLYIHRVKAVPCFQMHCLVDTCSYCVPCSVFLDIPRHHDKNYYGTLLLLYRSTVTALIRSKLIQLAYLAGSIKGGGAWCSAAIMAVCPSTQRVWYTFKWCNYDVTISGSVNLCDLRGVYRTSSQYHMTARWLIEHIKHTKTAFIHVDFHLGNNLGSIAAGSSICKFHSSTLECDIKWSIVGRSGLWN